MTANRIEHNMHREALLTVPRVSEITPEESRRAGEWEREQVKAAQDYAAWQRELRKGRA